MKQTWRSTAAGALAALMLTTSMPSVALAKGLDTPLERGLPFASLLSTDEADFTIADGVLTEYKGTEKNVVIPEGVTTIGDGSAPIFGADVESVVIPASVTAIADNAFYTCTGLKSVVFANGSQLKTIGESAFYAVNQLQSLSIPEGVTSIGQYAFAAMNKLETIDLPASLTGINGMSLINLFARGTSGGAPEALAAVNIADGNEDCVSYDGAVYSIDGKTLIYCPAQKKSIEWKPGVETIGEYAFLKTTMENVKLPDGLKTVSDKAFYSGREASLSVPGSVETIGSSAFYMNSKLKSVRFAEGLKQIGSMAFSETYFSGGAEIVLPASLESVGSSAFDCLGDNGGTFVVKVLGKDTVLGGYFVPNSAKITLCGLAGSTAEAYAENLGEGRKLTFQLIEEEDTSDFTIENGVLTAYTGTAKNVVIPSVVTTIGDGSAPIFGADVESVIIPASVTAIADNAFYVCTGLKSVVFADGSQLKTIGESAFYAVNQLQSLSIPEGVTSIGQYAFAAMNKLETIDLPASLTGINGMSLINLFARGTSGGAPEALAAVNIADGNEDCVSYDGAVYSIDGKTLIYCPAQKKSIEWKPGVETIGEYAFLKTAMENVELPDGLKTVSDKAFYLGGEASLSVPGSVETIGGSAFYMNSKLKSVRFAEGLKQIGSSAFSETYFSGGAEIVLPASLESVGSSAFDCLGDGGGTFVVKVLGKDTELGSYFVPNSAKITLCGLAGSTAEAYAENLGEGRKLTFQLIEAGAEVAVESVSLPGTLVLTAGGSSRLTAVVLPENATDRSLTWSSSNEAVASVDQNGTVTAGTVGSAIITATAKNGKSASCAVTVQEAGDFVIENGVLTAYKGTEKNVVIPEGMTTIGDGSAPIFGNQIESVTIPASATAIADNAFYSCTGLKSVVFADGSQLKTIGEGAFYAANQLQSLSIPEGVTSIGQYAFAATSKLETIDLPASLTEVCGGTWFGNLFARGTNGAPEALTAVRIAEGNQTYCAYDGAVYSADGKTLLYCPAQKKSIEWKSGVEKIGEYAFLRSTMPSMTMPASVTAIETNAFNRAQLTTIELPGSVKTIGSSAFFFSSVENLVLNEGLERIEASAFSQSHVAQVTIPASTAYIGRNAFDFEYGSDFFVRLLGKDTQLADDFIPYSYTIAVYGPAGSTAEAYVAAKQADKGSSCKLTFHADGFVEATGITLDRGTLSLRRTGTAQLTATLQPEGAQTAVAWSSSDPTVATVSSSGLVTAVQQGETVITASAGKLTATCTVHVVIGEGESDYLINDAGEITGYLGTDWTTLTIPAEVDGKPVTGVAAGAFTGCRDIETVTLPDSVTSIGAEAFASCTRLKQIDLSHVTGLGRGAFRQCTALQSVTLGEGMTVVTEEAFQSCSALRSVTLPSTITELGKGCFAMCMALDTLTLPEGLTTIHASALKKCPLATLHLPASFRQMGDEYMGDVFEDPGSVAADTTMTSITVDAANPLYTAADGLLFNKEQTAVLFCPRGRVTAVVPEGVTEIGRYAFFMCFDLQSVQLPSTLKTVREQAFHYCEGLTDCELPAGLERVEDSGFFGCEEWDGVDRLPSSLQYIGPYAFCECKGTKIVVPEGITELPEYAFWGYEESLKEIVLPSTLRTIGDSAFAWAKNVKSLTIPEGVTSIGESCFGRMDALESLTLPSTLQRIGKEAFDGGAAVENRLLEVYIPASVTEIGADTFADRAGLTIIADSADTAAARYAQANGLKLRLKDGGEVDPDFEIVNGVLVAYHGTDSEVVIPNGVTEIGPSVFEAAEEGEEGFDLLKVTIPASVTKISDRAFYGAELTEVVFAEGSALRELGRSAFAYCAKLPAITLPEGLEIIGANAFDGDGKLGEIAIPATVTEIGDYAFNVCSGLKAVRFASGNVSQLKTIGSFAFYQCYRLTSLEIPEGVVSIGDSALRIARGLKRVYLPSTLTQLGTTEAPAVFAPVRESVVLTGADDLQSITVADGNPNYCSKDGLLYTADGRTLLYCPAGRTGTVTVADGTQTIGENAFHRSQADHVVLPDGLKTIGARGFIKGGFTSIELPDSIERIGASAFFFCEKLKTVQLGAGLQTIESSAFSEAPLTNVTVPAGVQTIGTNAFDNIRGWIRFAGKDTVLEEECLSGSASLTVYGHAGSTAEAFVAAAQEQLGDRCGLRFVSIDDFVGVTAVQLAQTALSLKQRESAQLSASVTPENATNTALVYKSLNSRVASVDADGRVTALQPGTAVIRVLSPDGPYAECTVTVTRDESYSDFTIDERGFITGYAGEDADLVIPETVSGKTVVGIADGAFRENWSIESLTLPDTLREIGADAFSRCGNLARIHFGSGLKTIGARAFEYCTHLQELELPEGLETMGEYVFDSCENLESVVLPTTLRVIPQGAFHICWRLRTLNVPEGVESIGKDAFYECEGMTALTLPTSLRTICTGAFAACVRLTEVTIPEGVETIEQQAFMSCTALTRIHLPATLNTLGGVYAGDAFERSDVLGCDHLTTVTVTAGSPYFSAYDGLLYNADGTELVFCPRGLTTAAVREGTQRIGDYAFFYCRSLESVSLPSTLKTIGESAMGICERLTSLRLPEGVEHIDRSAFASDAALVSVRLPSTLKTVGPHAFLGTGLQKLELPAGVQSIGEQALAYNTALTSVTIRSGVTDLGADLFRNTPDVTIWTDSSSAPIYAYAKANGIPVRLLSSGGSGGSGGGSGSVSAGHDVTVPAAANGSVSVSPKSAAKGDTVTVTVTPDKGYTLGSLTVTDGSGNRLTVTDKGNGKYTFTMPDGDVRITASFRAASGSTGFADVAADAWYAEAVAWAAEKGVTAGTADGVFSPDGVCTRAQVVTFLWRANGCPAPSGSGRSFADVPAGAWYAEAVAWAVEQGITEGVSANRFAPNAAVTRAQTVTFLWRAAGKPAASGGSFADVPADTWYASAVAWAAEQGVTSGMTADTFAPDASCTRAQIVTFLYRAAK